LTKKNLAFLNQKNCNKALRGTKCCVLFGSGIQDSETRKAYPGFTILLYGMVLTRKGVSTLRISCLDKGISPFYTVQKHIYLRQLVLPWQRKEIIHESLLLIWTFLALEQTPVKATKECFPTWRNFTSRQKVPVFWIRRFWGRPGSFHQQAKKLTKTWISSVKWLLNDLLSLKTM
jgi:hypothetical protein